jgi:hypothetical protein
MCKKTTLTDQNYIHEEEMRSNLNAGKAWYHSVQNPLSSLGHVNIQYNIN